EVHGIADGLLLVVVVRERQRCIAVADRNRAGILDLLQRAILSEGLEAKQAQNDCGNGKADHWVSLRVSEKFYLVNTCGGIPYAFGDRRQERGAEGRVGL